VQRSILGYAGVCERNAVVNRMSARRTRTSLPASDHRPPAWMVRSSPYEPPQTSVRLHCHQMVWDIMTDDYIPVSGPFQVRGQERLSHRCACGVATTV
jgi:hypothetical protein